MGRERLTRCLLRAICAGNMEAARHFIRRGADVNWRSRHRNRTMFHAALRSHTRAAEWIALLLEAGAIPIVPPEHTGETIPQLAARNGDLESLRLLHEAGLDLGARQYSDRSALLEAVEAEALDCVEYLVTHGLDPAAMTRNHWQLTQAPLWRAATKASRPILQALVQAGVQGDRLEELASQARKWAQTARDESYREEWSRITRYLEEAADFAASSPVSRSGR